VGGVGYLAFFAWNFWAVDRDRLAEEYLSKAESEIDAGNSDGLWELNKAYMLGNLSKSFYEKKEGVYLARLGDERARVILSNLIEKNFVDDEVWYQYGLILMKSGEHDRAEYVFQQISGEVEEAVRKDVFCQLAYIQGGRGNWETVGQLLEKSEELKVENQRCQQMKIAYDMISGIYDQDFFTTKEEAELNDLNGDRFTMRVVDWWLEMGLTDWGRTLLSDMYLRSLDKSDLDWLYAKSYLMDNNCVMAQRVLAKMIWQWGVGDDFDELAMKVSQCEDNKKANNNS